MLITRCRQLPDGEELVWAEDGSLYQDGLDPRESAITRRGLALSQTSVRRTRATPTPPSVPPADVVERLKLKVQWR
jgi:hypothetical protein